MNITPFFLFTIATVYSCLSFCTAGVYFVDTHSRDNKSSQFSNNRFLKKFFLPADFYKYYYLWYFVVSIHLYSNKKFKVRKNKTIIKKIKSRRRTTTTSTINKNNKKLKRPRNNSFLLNSLITERFLLQYYSFFTQLSKNS